MSKFSEVLSSHKKLIHQIGLLEEKELHLPENISKIIVAKLQARELALAHSNCRCSKCDIDERLSFHHFVLKPYKAFMEFKRWVTARTYWNNLLVLCWKCHGELHKINMENKKEGETDISEKFRLKVIKKYGLDTTPFTSNKNQHVKSEGTKDSLTKA